jgi:hypothetical protein
MSFVSTNFAPLEKIANAVLYEGFLLYPYRKSSIKNQQRWHFGTLGPEGAADPSLMQTQCLVEGDERTEVDIRLRFLQDEIERQADLPALRLAVSRRRDVLRFPPIESAIEIDCERARDGSSSNLYRVTFRIRNEGREGLMLSTHLLLGVRNGAFVSLLDPPPEYQTAADACRSTGVWPVMAGQEGDRNLMLCSPIILYDYPQIAPESVGDFFDGTEIDEILSLRVLTLSDDEKSELRSGDEAARRILERTETLPPEQLGKMHGAIRNLRKVAKLEFREGDRVRLRPRAKTDIAKGDIFDIALEGKVAVVECVERDFEDRIHLAVTVEDDPGRDFGVARQIGHRFFFSPEEVELL